MPSPTNTILTTLAQISDPMRPLWLPPQDSTFASKQDGLFMFIFWLCTVVFVVMMGVMIFWALRYKRRPGVAQQRSASHNTLLELSWSVLPLFVLAAIFVWGFRDYIYMHVAPAGAEEVTLRAYQWNWELVYDNGGRSAATMRVADKAVPIFPVPQGVPVRVVMHSTDVIHSFFVPDFRTKIDVFPNRYTTIWFHATSQPQEQYDENTGEYLGRWIDHMLFCAEYCGEGHSQMGAVIRVMSEADFDEFKQTAADLYKDKTPAEIGALVYTLKGCNACHTVDGSVSTGPTWKGIWGQTHRFTDGTSGVVDENYVRESILTPSAKIVAGFPNQMQSYQGQISEEEIEGIIAYLKSLQ